MVKPSRKNNGPVRVSGVLTALFVLFWSSILIVQLKGWNIKNGIVVMLIIRGNERTEDMFVIFLLYNISNIRTM